MLGPLGSENRDEQASSNDGGSAESDGCVDVRRSSGEPLSCKSLRTGGGCNLTAVHERDIRGYEAGNSLSRSGGRSREGDHGSSECSTGGVQRGVSDALDP